MKTNNSIMFAGAGVLVIALAFGFAVVRPVLAQVAATSTDSTAPATPPGDTVASSTPSAASSTPVVENVSTSTGPAESSPAKATAATPKSSEAAAPDTSVQKSPTEPPPVGLTEVHIIGTKYVDYFTDGSTTIEVPGDPNVDRNLDKPNALIPTHAGMTWVHTTGDNLYDTPSGDLDVGDYAVQADGSYVQHAPPFVSSTSTPAQLSATTTDNTAAGTSSPTSVVASPSVPDTSTLTATPPSGSSSSTTASAELKTSPAI